jgi:hypothetical protein
VAQEIHLLNHNKFINNIEKGWFIPTLFLYLKYMTDFTHILNQLCEHLESINYQNGDISDVGNEIGIALGNYIQTEVDLKDLIQGLRHGISLSNGDH